MTNVCSKARRLELADEAGWRCFYCNAEVFFHWVEMEETGVVTVAGRVHPDGRRQGELDHIVPRSLGGTDRITNLRLACWLCNARRGNDVDWASDEWFEN